MLFLTFAENKHVQVNGVTKSQTTEQPMLSQINNNFLKISIQFLSKDAEKYL